MATINNSKVKFAFLQAVLATYIGNIFDNHQLQEEYAGNDHSSLLFTVWDAYTGNQMGDIDLSRCNKVMMIKALRARVHGTIKLNVDLPSAWNQKLRDAVIDNTVENYDVAERRIFNYQQSIGLKEAKDFCDWMVTVMFAD